MNGKRVLLILSGGIAAYKGLELIRLLRKAGCGVTCVMTATLPSEPVSSLHRS